MDIAGWLRAIGAAQYVQNFRDHDIDAALLPSITADDLRDIGVGTVGHRRLILNAIAALRAGEPEPAEPTEARSGEDGRAAFVRGQRRPVAVLFADLSGFTQLSGELDDEALRAILVRYVAMAEEAVKRNGGVVDKQIGDAVMGVFGAPVARSDDAANAARAALAIEAGMAALSEACRRPLQAHVGLAVGEVIVGGGSGAPLNLIGAPVNLAARITAAARPGEALASDALARQLAEGFRLEDRGAFAAKGIDEPVHVWRLLGEGGTPRATHPFVGRRVERAQIETALDAARASGAGALVHIRGEPGIGKSRLAAEAIGAAEARGFASIVAHALEFGEGHARHPLRRIADALLGLDPDADPAARAAAVARVRPALSLGSLGEPFLIELADADLSPDQRSLVEALPEDRRRSEREGVVAALAVESARSKPLLLVIEDVHWADDLLASAARRLLHLADQAPLVILTTARPDNDRFPSALREAPRRIAALTLDLGPLQPEEAAEAAEAFDVSTEARRRCLDRAAGNPLFLDQLLRNADELRRTAVPASLRTLILARIDRLAGPDRDAIEAASALGERFDPDALGHVLGVARLDLAALIGAGMLRRSGADVAFGHALIRDAAYQSLLREPRQALHLKAARWYENRDVILYATHAKEAGAPEAASAFRRAVEDRLSRYRAKEALDLLDSALGLELDAADRRALTLLRASTLLELGRARDSAAVYQDALGMALDDAAECSARIGLASALRILDDIPGALAEVERAEGIATRNDWPLLLSQGLHLRGNLLFPTGRAEECHRAHRLALETAERSGDKEAIARALGGLGDAEYVGGRIVSAGECFRRCVAASVEAGLGRVEASNWPMAALATVSELRLGDALVETETAIARARSMGLRRAALISHHIRAVTLMELGRDEEALADLEEARRLTRELEAWRFEAENLTYIAEIDLRAGGAEKARAELETALGIARSTDMAYWGAIALADLARTEPERQARAAMLAEIETLLPAAASHCHWYARRALIELGWERRDPDLIDFNAAALDGYCRPETAPLLDAIVGRGRALARVLRGERSPELAAEIGRLRAIVDHSGSVLLALGLEAA